jgi:flagellar L-ring protein precursor FlgH
MRLQQVVLFGALTALLAGCSLMTPPPGLKEDEFAIPVDEPTEKVVAPGSLWNPNARFADIYNDSRAHQVGDLLVVQIVETSSAEKTAKTESTKTNTSDNSVTSLLGLPLDKSSIKGYGLSPEVNFSTSTDFEADGKTSRDGSISGTVTARVERVLPSGNLVIKGKKQTRVNSEIQYIIISGIVRSQDVSPRNTIQSNYIADLQLDYYGSGIIGDQQSKGFISRALDKIWPF